MNPTKFTVYYLDGTVENIYGNDGNSDDRVFQISIETDDGYDYVYIPISVVRKVTENG